MNEGHANAAVARDLEAIFGPEASEAAPLPRGRSLAEVGPARRVRGGRVVLVGAPLCAAIIAGLTLGYGSMPARSTGAERATVRPAATRAPAPVAVATSVPAPALVLSPDRAATSAATDVVAAAPVPSRAAVPDRAEAVHQPAREQAFAVEEDRCPAGMDDDACLYADVRAADRRLRRAYRQAADAGVPSAMLSRLARRWDRALDRSLDAPGETIQRYDDMAAQLREAAAYERGERPD